MRDMRAPMFQDVPGLMARKLGHPPSVGIHVLPRFIGRILLLGMLGAILGSLPAAVPARAAAGPGGLYNPLPGARILDTRIALGASSRVPAGGTLNLIVAGRGGVPAGGATAVVINLTVTGPGGDGYLTAWPAGQPQPVASNLNFSAGQTIADLAELGIGVAGSISIYLSASADVVADVSGYVDSNPGGTAGRFNPVLPSRLVDTRSGLGGVTLGPNQSMSLAPLGRGGVPLTGVGAIVLNLTATNPTANWDYLTVWPHGAAVPTISSVNFNAGQTVANRVFAALGKDGLIDIYNTAGRTDVVIDLNGWFTDPTGSAGGAFYPLPPSRILDTRFSSGAIGPGGAAAVPIAGQVGVPNQASAVVATVTSTRTSAQSNLTAWPGGSAMPPTSDENWLAGKTVANLAVVALGANGNINLANAYGCADVIVDVVGYYDGPPLPATAGPPTAVACPKPKPTSGYIPVPWNSMWHSLSCEAASLQMVLAYHGIGANQNDVMNFIGQDRRPVYYDASGMRWGDPYQIFVGSVDGEENTPTGYGMKYPPLAAAATHFGLTVLSAKEGMSSAEVYDAVLAGHPVIVWGTTDYNPHTTSRYTAFDGRPVNWGPHFEHVFVIVAVWPDGVGLLDPLRNSSVVGISKPRFETQWAVFSNAAIVIA